MEVEEAGIGTNTLSFDEYVELRLFSLIIKIIASTPSYKSIFKFIESYGSTIFDLAFSMLKSTNFASNNLQIFFEEFKKYTTNELWDSDEELIQHYQDPNEYEKLLNGTVGQNVAYYFHAIAISEHMHDFTDFIIHNVKKLINQDVNSDFYSQLI